VRAKERRFQLEVTSENPYLEGGPRPKQKLPLHRAQFDAPSLHHKLLILALASLHQERAKPPLGQPHWEI